MFLMILLQNLLMRILAMVSFAWVCTAAPYAHRLTAHPAKLARIRRRLTHSYTGETPDASEAMSTRTQVLHVHFGLLYMRTVLQSLKNRAFGKLPQG